jgi:hypothetical protein
MPSLPPLTIKKKKKRESKRSSKPIPFLFSSFIHPHLSSQPQHRSVYRVYLLPLMIIVMLLSLLSVIGGQEEKILCNYMLNFGFYAFFLFLLIWTRGEGRGARRRRRREVMNDPPSLLSHFRHGIKFTASATNFGCKGP